MDIIFEELSCLCGCKNKTKFNKNIKDFNKYVNGHNNIGKKNPIHSERMKGNTFWSLVNFKAKRGKIGKDTTHWKGGKYKSKDGYIQIYSSTHPNSVNGKYVPEHRLVMEQHIGRYLTKDEVVHHINGTKDDNRIENLKLFSNKKEHGHYHYGHQRKNNNYKSLYKPNHPNSESSGWISEHRFIMSEFLGRPLEKSEVVHHINGIKKDNRIENLKLCSRKEHRSIHNKEVINYV